MDSQTSVTSLAERLGSRRDKLKEHHKEHRLSKADIGGPISARDSIEIGDTPESLGAPAMVLRCVIIHRDEKGYGLTVSGDNPVYVQSVKEDGAAFTAGVQQGDRIIKVNGTNVTDYNHIEVVKLIKAGPYVALTLLGPPLSASDMATTSRPNSTTGIASSNFIMRAPSQLTTKETFHDEKVNTIKKMLEQEKNEVERIKEQYAKDPNKKLLEELAGAQKLLQDLEKQLWKAEKSQKQNASKDIPILQDIPTKDLSSGAADMELGGTHLSEDSSRFTDDLITNQKKTLHPDQASQRDKKTNDADGSEESTLETDSSQLSNSYFDSHGGSAGPHQNAASIMNFEDDDELAEESDAYQDHGPFKDYENLRTRPAHMAIFINYVFGSHDPSNLLLVLTVDSYRQLSSNRDMVKQSDNICKNYLLPSAPLKIDIDDGISKSIVDAVHSKSISDEGFRTAFDPVWQHSLREVRQQLQSFCNKREQGLSNCFGEDKLAPNMDHSQEVRVVEDVLGLLIQDLGSPAYNTEDLEIQKMNAKMEALEKILIQLSGKRKSKLTSRIGSMLRPNRPAGPTMRPKTAGSMESILDEQNKRMSLLGKWTGKKAKKGESSTVIPVVQASSVDSGESGLVSQALRQMQDAADGVLPNVVESSDNNLAVNYKKDKNMTRSGSFRGERRPRSGTGKSNSDPDVNTVEMAVSQLSGNAESAYGDIPSQISTSVSNSSMSSTGTNSIIGNEDLITPLISAYPELDVQPESQWSANTPRDVIKMLDKKECKRQEIINELFHTEKHHVRDLVILDLLFYKSMQNDAMLNQDELYLVFPNLQEILQMHRQLNKGFLELKEKDGHVIKDISEILMKTFDGAEGNKFKEECAKFCGNQTSSLEFIKEKCKKDQKFNSFIQTQEKHPICRRLRLKDFVPVEFQRLTKYPLLLENIIKNTSVKKKDEIAKLRRVHKQCKDILSYVNKAVKDAEDHQKIVEIQKNLDSSSLQKVNHPIVKEYKDINLVERTLIHQGTLTWRITQSEKKKAVVLHCVLFEDIMVLLQKQDEKYVLKCHASTALNSAKDEKTPVQPPILKLSKVFVRNVATDKKAFFVVSNSEFGPQIYELVASTVHEMQEWLKVVTATAEVAKKKDNSSITHMRRDGFSVDRPPTRSRSNRSKTPDLQNKGVDAVDSAHKEPEIDNVLTDESLAGDENLLNKIKKRHQEIAAGIEFKHTMLASYAGIDSSQLENILDMSATDSDADSKTLILQSLTNVKKMTEMLNDLLLPDTVFLQPVPQPTLQPIAGENSVDFPTSAEENPVTPTPATVENPSLFVEEVESTNNDTAQEERWAVPLQSPPSQLQGNLPVQDEIADKIAVTPDRRSNASLDLLVSDYETASEPNSPPSSIGEQPSFSDTCVEKGDSTEKDDNSSSVDPPLDDNVLERNQDAPSSHSDAGIGLSESQMDAEPDNTLSATENSVSELLASPTQLVDLDLLDLDGPALSPPELGISTSPSSPRKDGLMARTSTLPLTKMIQYTNKIESHLLQLMQNIKDLEDEKKLLMDENARLASQISQNDTTGESSNGTSIIGTQEENFTTSDQDTTNGSVTSPDNPIGHSSMKASPVSPKFAVTSDALLVTSTPSENKRFVFGDQLNLEPTTGL